MIDFQIFKIVDVITSYPVDEWMSGSSRVVRIRLQSSPYLVAEVTINGYLSAGFTISGYPFLDVVIPPELTEYPVDTLSFLLLSSERSYDQGEHQILYDIGKISRKLSGELLLMQKWVRFMLMTPGTDRFDPSAGVGLATLAGNVNHSNLKDITVKLARMHNDCKAQIIARQTLSDARYAPSELLKDARFLGALLDGDAKLLIRTYLTNANNRTFGADMRI